MKPILERGTNCRELVAADETRVLVDGAAYYGAFYQAARNARRTIHLAGWQFDTRAKLKPDADSSVTFIAFLNQLCRDNPNLHIYIAAWNYSVVYALEREWFQNWRFGFNGHERVHFRFAGHPEPGGSYHQKIAIIDERLAFSGGMDICDSRWDTREHSPDNAQRRNVHERDYPPFHDVQVGVTGPIVEQLCGVFWTMWERAGGERSESTRMEDENPPAATIPIADESATFELRGRQVGLSRTRFGEANGGVYEIERLYEDAIDQAERLIYIENQYFTSRTVVRALVRRFCDESRSKLTVVIVLPNGAQSKKEGLAIGDRQNLILSLVGKQAQQYGHAVRVLVSGSEDSSGKRIGTYIHSKLLIVDDRFVTIGSANLMNRSMRVDHEFNLSWDAALEAEPQRSQLQSDIRRLRASLLAEHAGADSEQFLDIEGVLLRIDEQCESEQSKLMCKPVDENASDDPVFAVVFDPAGPLNWDKFDTAISHAFDTDGGPLRSSTRRLGQRLGVVDIE